MNQFLIDKCNLKAYSYLFKTYNDDDLESRREKLSTQYKNLMEKYCNNYKKESNGS